MKLGVNHPAGPFEFLARWDALAIATLLDHLDAHYRGERYRVSPGCASAPGWRSSVRARRETASRARTSADGATRAVATASPTA
jgi:hypothetical protein